MFGRVINIQLYNFARCRVFFRLDNLAALCLHFFLPEVETCDVIDVQPLLFAFTCDRGSVRNSVCLGFKVSLFYSGLDDVTTQTLMSHLRYNLISH